MVKRAISIAVLVTTILIAQASAMSTVAAEPAPKPNLIIILVDDLSVDLLNAMFDEGRAPNIQQYLRAEGIEFQNSFVTNAICCASRATLLRGQYSHNHMVLDIKSDAIPNRLLPGITWPGWFPDGSDPGHESSTIATWLQNAGYYTGHVGRYLNGYGICAPNLVCMNLDTGSWTPGEPDPRLYIPPGWDSWQGLIDPTTYNVYDYQMNENGVLVDYGNTETDYQTDVLAQQAIQFIDDGFASGQPFFLHLATFAPHVERFTGPGGRFDFSIRPAPRHEHLIDGNLANDELPLPFIKPSFNEQDMSDKPSCPNPPEIPFGENRCPADLPLITSGPGNDVPDLVYQFKSMMAATIAIDDLVGSIIERLVANDIANDTVIIFTSDNGWLYGEHRATGKEVGYEESIRVPLLIRSPGHDFNKVALQIVLNNDLAPTLAELGGVSPPYDPDGTSLVPLLETPLSADWHRYAFLEEHWYIAGTGAATYFAVRYKNSRYNFFYSEIYSDLEEPNTITGREFYNLNLDPFQRQSAILAPGSMSGFSNYTAFLRNCTGQNCRQLEALNLP